MFKTTHWILLINGLLIYVAGAVSDGTFLEWLGKAMLIVLAYMVLIRLIIETRRKQQQA